MSNPQAEEFPLSAVRICLISTFTGTHLTWFLQYIGRWQRLLPPSETGRRQHVRDISWVRFLVGGMSVWSADVDGVLKLTFDLCGATAVL